jgi:hypothetical protein
MEQRYYLRTREWTEVTKEEFMAAENSAGFHPMVHGELATGGFQTGKIQGCVRGPGEESPNAVPYL